MILGDETIKKLDAFALSMREAARGGAGGMRRSRSLGSSVEFSDFRSYSEGDDLRRVDWNAYARFDKLFLKLFLDEQETTLRILLDASGSMRHGEPDKWALALKLAAALAYLSLSRYDRVVVAPLSAGRAVVSRTFSGRQAFPEVEAFLEAVAPAGETALDASAAQVPAGRGRGICILLSDLLTESDWRRGVKSLLFRRQEVALLHILSPEELSPELTGAVRLTDAEGAPPLEIHLTPDALRRYQETLSAFLHAAESFCAGLSIPYVRLSSEADFEREALRALMAAGMVAGRG